MSNQIIIKSWSDEFGSYLDESTLIRKYSQPEKYRVTTSNYPADVNTGGFTRSGKCYVLSGSFKFVFRDERISLRQGDCCDFPAGEFKIKSLSKDKIEILFILKIPQ